ncbi:isochorismatase family cysteine hydrolase [Oscillatoria laete-virens NRMC-F 0139]|nr:isochorismatase family cysteine hydrolase [Oscillatoria laete-virens]MDL5051990.1 isochorismatase family cysteine hydrolase [Oscillatoria laete-virens NRMC-F 0139]
MATRQKQDLYGSAPDKSRFALLLIDTINDFTFPGGEELLPHALEIVPSIVALKKRCARLKIPVVYVNDNFGRWRSDFKTVLMHCLRAKSLGKTIARSLKPSTYDYFVLKPKHSGFFESTLHTLLQHLGAKDLIITGFTADICVLFTANDAFLHGYRVHVPANCTVASTPAFTHQILNLMQNGLKADLTPSTALRIPLGKRKSG